MNWHHDDLDGVWEGRFRGVPIAFVKRLAINLYAYKCFGPDGMIAQAQLNNYTITQTQRDVEQTLRDMGWNFQGP